jgi:hypothetical protein
VLCSTAFPSIPRAWLHRLRRCFVQLCSSPSQLHGLPGYRPTGASPRLVRRGSPGSRATSFPHARLFDHAGPSRHSPFATASAPGIRTLYEAHWWPVCCVTDVRCGLRGRAHARLEATPSSSRQTCTFAPTLIAGLPAHCERLCGAGCALVRSVVKRLGRDAGYLVNGVCTPLSRRLSPQLTFGMRPLRLPDSNRLDRGWGKLIYSSSKCTNLSM